MKLRIEVDSRRMTVRDVTTSGSHHRERLDRHEERWRLSDRLRELRTTELGHRLKQAALGRVLGGVGGPTVSGWENGNENRRPRVDRLRDYARFFCTERSLSPTLRLLTDDELTAEDIDRKCALELELLALLRAAESEAGAEHEQTALRAADDRSIGKALDEVVEEEYVWESPLRARELRKPLGKAQSTDYAAPGALGVSRSRLAPRLTAARQRLLVLALVVTMVAGTTWYVTGRREPSSDAPCQKQPATDRPTLIGLNHPSEVVVSRSGAFSCWIRTTIASSRLTQEDRCRRSPEPASQDVRAMGVAP